MSATVRRGLELHPDSYRGDHAVACARAHARSPVNRCDVSPAPLQRAARRLEVPNAGSAVAAHMGTAWPSLEPAVHVNQFAPASLRGLFERAGLRCATCARARSRPTSAARAL